MKKIISLLFFAVLLMPGAMSFAQTGPTITVATDATWPPMEYVNANKQIVGFDIDREDWRQPLQAIAAAAHGQYLPAARGDALPR